MFEPRFPHLTSNTSDLIAFGALITSLIALGWNIVRDLFLERVKLEVDLRLGAQSRVVGTSKAVFFSGSDIPKEVSKVELLFSVTNVGRRNVVVEKINGDYNHPEPSRVAFFFTARELPKLLEPYATHSEISDSQELVQELLSGEVKSVYAIDTKGKKWYVPSSQIEKAKKDYKTWQAKRR